MARNLMADLKVLKLRVDDHDRAIRDLQEITESDRETSRLRDEGLDLLKRLSENHSVRITRVEQDVEKIRAKIAIGPSRK